MTPLASIGRQTSDDPRGLQAKSDEDTLRPVCGEASERASESCANLPARRQQRVP
ncbi:hypothetical protein HYDPIDRAFT_107932 [Hydnomerulius pinastri MD-312]|nr:hypothetical protein HYDPIDRAFT_107932 [Hydnomerulius pinastri MD-312]